MHKALCNAKIKLETLSFLVRSVCVCVCVCVCVRVRAKAWAKVKLQLCFQSLIEMDFVFCAASQFDSAAMDYLKASQSCSPPCSPFKVNPEGKYICKIAILIHTHTHTLSVSLSLSHTHIHTHTR